MTDANARRGSRRKRWTILVTSIPPERYPDYQQDLDHAFASMDAMRRIEEIDQVCAKLWLRMDDAVKGPSVVKKPLARAA